MKLFWLDLETTGIDCIKDYIVEMAILYENTITKEKSSFYRLINPPQFPDHYDQNAGAVNGLTCAKLMDQGKNEKFVYLELVKFFNERIDRYDKMDKAIICGYNVGFDKDFLRQLFIRQGDNYFGSYFFSASIDVMSTLAMALKNGLIDPMPDYKLTTAALKFNFDLDAHSAKEDIKVTRKIQLAIEKKLGMVNNE